MKIALHPVDANLKTLLTNRDKLPSGKQIIALTLTWDFVSLFINFKLPFSFLSALQLYHTSKCGDNNL